MLCAIYAVPIAELLKEPKALPIYYKEYQDVFKKKNANLFPQQRPYDCAIDL
jgi:hypothetical protein